MKKFTIVYQDPFETKPREWGVFAAADVLAQFDTVDWLQLQTACFERQGDVMEHYYYVAISCTDALNPALKTILAISGEYTTGRQLEKYGPLLTLHYEWPMEKISRGFLGLGKPKLKIDYETSEMESCTIAFARKCIAAFMHGDSSFLAGNIAGAVHPDTTAS